MARRCHGPGFTLLELLFVMLLLGLVLGIGVAGVERMDPGARGLQTALISFLESSRDRARASGHPVEVRVESRAGGAPELARYAFRRVLEASFEPSLAAIQGIELTAPAALDGAGRFGTALDLRQGGGAALSGRGGAPPLDNGLSLEFHLLVESDSAGVLIEWRELMTLRLQRSGALQLSLRVRQRDQAGESAGEFRLETPAGVILPGQWHHVRVTAASERLSMSVNGKERASDDFAGQPARPAAALYLGDAKSGFTGRFDEFTLWARVREPGPAFREDVGAQFSSPRVLFDRDGLLDHAAHPQGVTVEIVEYGDLRARFRIGRFALEEGGA